LFVPECKRQKFLFQRLARRSVQAEFTGGTITSDAGALLLGELEAHLGILRRFAECFTDHRDPLRIEHTIFELLAQRVFALCLGYEDLNDHDLLRCDPLLATLVGKVDPTGEHRRRSRDRGSALAGKSTLNRLELRSDDPERDGIYKKISCSTDAVDRFLLERFVATHPQPPERVVLDFDATDDPLHGTQEGRFFHGYYGHYCYLPLYIFCGKHLLVARLRRSNIDQSKGALDELHRIVGHLRRVWPQVEVVVRADSGFARDELMTWCEANRVEYVLGLARNSRLEAALAPAMERARIAHEITGKAERVFSEIAYRTLDSWSRERRVIGKAEYLSGGANPRFIVTSLGAWESDGRELYEKIYCERGEMENRIKEQQLDLFADRTSAQTMKANQLRLYLASVAYVLMQALREQLEGTELERATCGTLRVRLLKIGALVRVSVRRVLVSLASSFPLQEVFSVAYARIRGLPMRC
jgi:Transposase DDE domain group 1